jgi:4-amino-4-deoxy-L-arabinose transferase-like glycosyltransferase
VGVLTAAALARVGWALQVQRPQELRDPSLYLLLGEQLATGNGYSYPMEFQGTFDNFPTAYYPPGYPLFLAPIFWVARLLPGDVSLFGTAVVANVVLSVLLVWLIFHLGRRLAGVAVGLVAAAVTALWPNLIFHSGVILTETLFLVLLVLTFLVAFATPAVARRPGLWRMVTVGVLLGLVGLVRPVSLVVAPLFLLLWWSDGVARAVRRTAIVAVAAVAVLLPWSVLSTIRMEAPVALSLNFGDNLCIGYRDGAYGGFALAPECFDGYDDIPRPESETERQSDNIERALEYIGDHPASVVTQMPDRARYTLESDWDGLQAANDYGARPIVGDTLDDLLRYGANAFYVVVALLAVGGVVVVVRRGLWADRRWQLLVLAAPVSLVSPLLTFGDTRFKMPIYPTLAVCAAVAVVTLARRGPVVDEVAQDASVAPGVSPGATDKD